MGKGTWNVQKNLSRLASCLLRLGLEKDERMRKIERFIEQFCRGKEEVEEVESTPRDLSSFLDVRFFLLAPLILQQHCKSCQHFHVVDAPKPNLRTRRSTLGVYLDLWVELGKPSPASGGIFGAQVSVCGVSIPIPYAWNEETR
ncbi:hypothetical protein V6N13_008088 [Hibiscus sabdariffa]